MKNLALSAIICGASILGLNFSTADAAINLEIEQLDKQNIISYRDSESNRYTGAERARRAIEGAERRERYEDYDRYRDRERYESERYERERRKRERQERYERERRRHYDDSYFDDDNWD